MDTNYKEKLSQCVRENFEEFKRGELLKTKEDIFRNAYKIHFYTELSDCLAESDFDLDGDLCEFLCGYGDGVLDMLYDEYLGNEYASIANWDDLTTFLYAVYAYERVSVSEGNENYGDGNGSRSGKGGAEM